MKGVDHDYKHFAHVKDLLGLPMRRIISSLQLAASVIQAGSTTLRNWRSKKAAAVEIEPIHMNYGLFTTAPSSIKYEC